MLLHEELTDKILHCFYEVYNELGYGFLERVYENALCFELEDYGLKALKQELIPVHYKSIRVGEYYSDIIVENKVILELKATPLDKNHELQLYNYLKATNIEVGLLLSFGVKPVFKRLVFSNTRKKIG